MDIHTERLVHEGQLYIAKSVNQLCQKYGLHCFLTGGSLLGAVKNHAIIPGDKDIDIGMLRDEYERFLSLADELPSDLALQEARRDEKYNWLFVKVYLRKTKLTRKNEMAVGEGKGIYIDVCPYDYVHKNRMIRKAEYILAKLRKHIMLVKDNVNREGKHYFIMLVLCAISCCVSRDYLIVRCSRERKKRAVVQNLVGGDKDDWFYMDEIEDWLTADFGGTRFNIPRYTRYLDLNYPGWKDKRLIRHDLESYIAEFLDEQYYCDGIR